MKMKAFIKAGLALSMAIGLTACMSPQQRYNQDYSVAKQNFAQQNYRTAFTRIQSPAKYGNADAQYALGYMYYYGKGTVANRQMANYWFQKAAQQGQPAAKRALHMMQSQPQQPNPSP